MGGASCVGPPSQPVELTDAAGGQHHFKYRMDFLRRALATALISLGETETARRFGREATAEADG